MRVAIADVNGDALKRTVEEIKTRFPDADLLPVKVDVSKIEEVTAFKDRVFEWAGEVSVVLNNAGILPPGGTSFSRLEKWHDTFAVNLFGCVRVVVQQLTSLMIGYSVVNVQQAFVPFMLPNENPSFFINTGSKQGITNPPGNTAYNASKAAVKSLTEGLAHELRERQSHVTAHLFMCVRPHILNGY
jgi:NAD(P)-dependent dehydrogenase (short-subunit alcohol dehydrogenase family)